MDEVVWELRIEGRVQGVGYRWSAQKKAMELGLSGWVRNEGDGSVLCRAWGRPEIVDVFVHWCEQGPPLARVRRVVRRHVEENPPDVAADSLAGGEDFAILA